MAGRQGQDADDRPGQEESRARPRQGNQDLAPWARPSPAKHRHRVVRSQPAEGVERNAGLEPENPGRHGVPQLVEQDRDKQGRDPDQRPLQIRASRAQKQGHQPEQRVHAHRDPEQAKPQVAGRWRGFDRKHRTGSSTRGLHPFHDKEPPL